jgi:hypothetical protein
MKLTRRNALIGLGSLVAGSGALVGTGAFSSVEADRTVSVTTAGDGSALLGLTADGEYVTGPDSGSTLTIDLFSDGSGVNQNAVTTLDGVISITNNSAESSDGTVNVGFDDGGNAPSGSATVTPSSDVEVTFYVDSEPDTGGTVTDDSTSAADVAQNGSIEVDVEVDTTVSGKATDNTLTILAEDQSPEDS